MRSFPEEKIRQALIERMVSSLGYPIECLVLEKYISHFPHLSLGNHKIPERRADLICFAKDIHPKHLISPLLLIECKAVQLDSESMQQLMGYNYYIQAPFIALANQEEILTGWLNLQQKKYQFIFSLPSYQNLIYSLKASSTI